MLPVVRHGGKLRGGASGFFKGRVRRILPPYYFSMALSLLLIATVIGTKSGSHWDVSLPVTIAGLLSHLFLVQDVWAPAQINHVYWSIAVECQIYVLFPMLVLLWSRLNPWAVIATTTTLGLLGEKLVTHLGLDPVSPQFLSLFAYGMLGASLTGVGDTRLAGFKKILTNPVFALVCAAVAIMCMVVNKPWLADFPVGALGASVLCATTNGRFDIVRRALGWRPLVKIGVFSYSLYLVHAPLVEIAWRYVVKPLHAPSVAGFLLLALLACTSVIGLCYLFFTFCERPFLSRKPGPSFSASVHPSEAWQGISTNARNFNESKGQPLLEHD